MAEFSAKDLDDETVGELLAKLSGAATLIKQLDKKLDEISEEKAKGEDLIRKLEKKNLKLQNLNNVLKAENVKYSSSLQNVLDDVKKIEEMHKLNIVRLEKEQEDNLNEMEEVNKHLKEKLSKFKATYEKMEVYLVQEKKNDKLLQEIEELNMDDSPEIGKQKSNPSKKEEENHKKKK